MSVMPGWWSAVATRSHTWPSGLTHLPAEHLLHSPHHPGLPPGSHLSTLCSCGFDLFKILHMNDINGVLTFIFQLLVLMCRQPHGSCMPPLQASPPGPASSYLLVSPVLHPHPFKQCPCSSLSSLSTLSGFLPTPCTEGSRQESTNKTRVRSPQAHALEQRTFLVG